MRRWRVSGGTNKHTELSERAQRAMVVGGREWSCSRGRLSAHHHRCLQVPCRKRRDLLTSSHVPHQPFRILYDISFHFLSTNTSTLSTMSGSRKRKSGSSNYVNKTTFVRKPGGARREVVTKSLGRAAVALERDEMELNIRNELSGTLTFYLTA